MQEKTPTPKMLSARPKVSAALLAATLQPFQRDATPDLPKLSKQKQKRIAAALLQQTGNF